MPRVPILALAKQQIFLWHVNYEWTTEVDRKSCVLNQRMFTQRFSSRDPITKLALASKCQICFCKIDIRHLVQSFCCHTSAMHCNFGSNPPYTQNTEFNIVAATMLRPLEPPKARAEPTARFTLLLLQRFIWRNHAATTWQFDRVCVLKQTGRIVFFPYFPTISGGPNHWAGFRFFPNSLQLVQTKCERTVIFCNSCPVLNFLNTAQIQTCSPKILKRKVQVQRKSKKLWVDSFSATNLPHIFSIDSSPNLVLFLHFWSNLQHGSNPNT